MMINAPLSSSYFTGPVGSSDGRAARSAAVSGRGKGGGSGGGKDGVITADMALAFLLIPGNPSIAVETILHHRPPRMPVGRPFVHAGDPEQFFLLEGRSEDLQADGQAVLREAARNADAR